MNDSFPSSPPQSPVSAQYPSAFPYYGTPPPFTPPAPPSAPDPATNPPGRPATASRSPRMLAVVGAPVVASLTAGAAGGWFAGQESASNARTPATTVPSAQTAAANLSGDPLNVKAIVAKLGPSVVAIN